MTHARQRSTCRRRWSLGLGLVLVAACNGSGDGDGSTGPCVAGQSAPCTCPDGASGVQSCLPSGSLGPCTCDDTTSGGTQTDGTPTGDASADATAGDLCGNGTEDPGECTASDPAYCPQDCEGDDTTGPGECMDQGPIYATLVPAVASRWESGPLVGFAAGQALCRETAMTEGVPGAGQVTVCDYVQVLQAELAGELAAVPMGTTAWLHRTTLADVMGMPSEPGVGGRCAEWSTLANDLADGEYAEFTGGGMISYVLDDDTFYDGVDTTHTQPGALECGTQTRAILCCHPTCTP